MRSLKKDINIKIPRDWEPRPYQLPLWEYMDAGGSRAVEVAHRRWGKDDVALHFTATQAILKPGTYWHMLPQYGQARKVVWDAVNPRTGMKRIDEAFPPEIRKKTRRQEMMIEFKNGSTWQLVGSDNYDSIVGAPPRGIVFSEWSIANPLAWAYLSPILEENGGWAIFIYTSRGNNHGRTMYEYAVKNPDTWFSDKCPATETDVFPAEALPRIRDEYMSIFGAEYGEAKFKQEYLCSWEGAVFGAYFSREMEDAREAGRITKVPHRPGLEVDTCWDLGIDDSMSIWFIQPVGQGFNVIDYYESTGYGLPHYAKVLKEKPYVYGNHWMPHDADQREMTNSEIAKSRVEVAEDLGIKPINVITRARNMEVIMQVHVPAVRNILSQCWFDEDKCSAGIAGLQNFRADYDEERKVLAKHYKHDWASHPAMSFITFAVGWEEPNLIKVVVPAHVMAPGTDELSWMGG